MSAIRLLCAALALCFATSAAADPIPFEELAPRYEAVKPEQVEADPTAFPDVLVLKLREGSRVRLVEGQLVPDEERSEAELFRLERADLSPGQVADQMAIVNDLLAQPPVMSVERMFVETPAETLEANKDAGEQNIGAELADLDLYYHVVIEAPDPQVIADLASQLHVFEVVELAYAQPVPDSPAPDLFPPAGDLTSMQNGQFGPAPAGLDAHHAWTWPGGRGEGARVIDIETGWTFDHEDLPAMFVRDGWNIGDHQHGTASLGLIAAGNDGFGMTGLASDAEIGAISAIPIYNVPAAIINAANMLDPGDVILIEQHYPAPTDGAPPCQTNCAQFGFVAVENSQGDFDAIRQAVATGMIVVEPAGNGGMDLDDPRYQGRFDRTVRDSGAIMVGARLSNSAAPPVWSNAGSRIDVHAWGDSVATLGYGVGTAGNLSQMRPPAPNDGDARQWYRDTFGGTSSASALIAGVVASLQGIRLAAGLDRLDIRAMRRLLIDTGTPQNTPVSRNIGAQPNLQAAIAKMHIERTPVRFIHTANSTNTGGWYEQTGYGCTSYPCVAGPIYTWRNFDNTVIEHPALDNNPTAVLQVTPRLGAFTNARVGVRYDIPSGRWTIVDLDGQPMVDGARYNVLLTHGFKLLANGNNRSGNRLFIDDPVANTDIGMRLLVTRGVGPEGVVSPHPVAAEFDAASNRWTVVQTDGAFIPDNAEFHLTFRDTSPAVGRVVAFGPTLQNGAMVLPHPMLDGRPEAIAVITGFEAPVGGNATVGADLALRFDAGLQQWTVVRADGAPLPQFAWVSFYVARDLAQEWLQVPESSTGVSASFTVRGDDLLVTNGRGETWAGVFATGRHDAEGWPGAIANGSFPLPGAPRFGLLIGFSGVLFHNGRFSETLVAGGTQSLSFRHNDDVAGNGDHWLQVRVRRFRE